MINVFDQEEQPPLYFTAPDGIIKQVILLCCIKTKPINILFETELDILKCNDSKEGHGEIAHLLGLSLSTVSTLVKNQS
jgi:hypothetical protein